MVKPIINWWFMVLFTSEIGGQDVVSFIVQLRLLYLNGDFFAFEKKIVWKISELIKDGSRESLVKLYCCLDPIYQIVYYDIKKKTTPISRKLQKAIEMASMPLYQMSEEVRNSYLQKLGRILSKDKA